MIIRYWAPLRFSNVGHWQALTRYYVIYQFNDSNIYLPTHLPTYLSTNIHIYIYAYIHVAGRYRARESERERTERERERETERARGRKKERERETRYMRVDYSSARFEANTSHPKQV